MNFQRVLDILDFGPNAVQGLYLARSWGLTNKLQTNKKFWLLINWLTHRPSTVGAH
jgi:hypothetical protein